MFAAWKKAWAEFKRAPPGRRFQDRHARYKRSPRGRSWWGRVLNFGGALVALAIAIVLSVAPGPAVVFFFIAGALLASESRAVARAFDWLEMKLRALARTAQRWWRRLSLPAKAAVVSLALLGVAGAVFVGYRVVLGASGRFQL